MIAVVRNLQPGDSTAPMTLSKVFAELWKRASDAQFPGATLLIDREVVLDADIDVPTTIDLRFIGAGRIVCGESAATLRLARTPRAGLWQVFGRPNEPETIPVVRFSTRCDPVYADWWGASGYNFTNWDNSAWHGGAINRYATVEGFQAALDAIAPCGGVVHIAPGTYSLTRTLRIHSGATLEGDDSNRVKLRWIRCDGIRLDPGAVDVVLSGFAMSWTPGPAGSSGGCTAIAMTSGARVRIEGIGLPVPTGSAEQFETGILQRKQSGALPTDRMTGLRILRCSPMAGRNLIVIEAADDVRLEGVWFTRNLTDGDHPTSVGLVIGSPDAAPCQDVRVLDGLFERMAVCIQVVKGDGLRIEGCYFETWFRNRKAVDIVRQPGPNYNYFEPSERRYILVQADPANPAARALSGEGLDVGFNYFMDTYYLDDPRHDVTPSPHVLWVNPFDRRMTRVFNLGSVYRLPDGKSLPMQSSRAMFLDSGSILYSENPGTTPFAWVCTSRTWELKNGLRLPHLAWSPIQPSAGSGPYWIRFGSLEPLESGNQP